jgi:hypothetical protein
MTTADTPDPGGTPGGRVTSPAHTPGTPRGEQSGA